MVRFNGKTIVDMKNNEYKMKIKKYLCKLMPPIHFSIGNVAQLFINGKYIFLWQDAKGQVCYCFDIYDREYFITSAIKLGNVLSQHFQCEIEVVNNEKEHLKKMVSAQAQLNKGIGDLERHNLYNGGMNFTNDSLPYLSNGYSNSVPVIQQNNYQHPLQNQESLYNGIIQLSIYYLESHLRTLYIKIDELPIVYKTLFRPNINMAFFYEKNMNCKNSYVHSKY